MYPSATPPNPFLTGLGDDDDDEEDDEFEFDPSVVSPTAPVEPDPEDRDWET